MLRFITLFTLVAFSCTSNQKTTMSPESAEQLMADFFTALSTADTLLMRQVTADDFVMYEHDSIWNTDSLLSLMSRTEGRIWEIQDFNFTADGNIGHFNYYNVSRNPIGRDWYESGLIVHTEEDLKLKFMHSTKLYLSQ